MAGIEAHTLAQKNWMALKLTWSGHEFLDAVRNPEIWRRTKEGAKAAGVAGIKAIFGLAVAYGKQMAKEKLGFDLG